MVHQHGAETYRGRIPRRHHEGCGSGQVSTGKRIGKTTRTRLAWEQGDWMISKKRYWGLALPIWVNDNDPTDFEVIGSYAELKERAVEGWKEFDGHTPHRPWIDKVKIKSKRKPGERMSRIPDVDNPWLDAGIVGFSTMKYNTNRDYWKKW